MTRKKFGQATKEYLNNIVVRLTFAIEIKGKKRERAGTLRYVFFPPVEAGKRYKKCEIGRTFVVLMSAGRSGQRACSGLLCVR